MTDTTPSASVVRVAILDAIHEQVGIIEQFADKPDRAQYGRWVEPGHKVGVVGVLDLDGIAHLVTQRLIDAKPSTEPEPVDDDPFPLPEGAVRVVLCKHCGRGIHRHGGGWRHDADLYRSCDPSDDNTTKAEP